jgi:oxygen-independent coproporphyrinogen III oxidase
MDVYLDYLEREAEIYRDFQPDVEISSLYVGGGTPNLMREEQYGRVLRLVERTFGALPDDTEKSIEGIPQLYKEERVQEIKAAGFNRVSMGVQQINDKLIHYSGRRQTRKQIFDAIEYFNKYDLAFNVDLIFGWPEQTIDQMLLDLQDLIDTGIRHITHYELNIGGISDFALKQRANLPSKSDVFEMYRISREFLIDNGFEQKTVFDWEKRTIVDNKSQNLRGHEYKFEENLRKLFELADNEILSRHEMLGLGYAAISFANGYPEAGQSWTTLNAKSLGSYYKLIDEGKLPVSAYYFRSDADVKLSFLFQSLLEMSIDRRIYTSLFGIDVAEELAEPLAYLEKLDWISISDDVIDVKVGAHLNIPIIQTVFSSERTKEITQEYKLSEKVLADA